MGWRWDPTHGEAVPPRSPPMPTWGPSYDGWHHGERLATLEANSRHQLGINEAHHRRLSQLEQHKRREEHLRRLKEARRDARRDVLRASKWLLTILLGIGYTFGIVPAEVFQVFATVLGFGG
jgi:hypothetical protein